MLFRSGGCSGGDDDDDDEEGCGGRDMRKLDRSPLYTNISSRPPLVRLTIASLLPLTALVLELPRPRLLPGIRNHDRPRMTDDVGGGLIRAGVGTSVQWRCHAPNEGVVMMPIRPRPSRGGVIGSVSGADVAYRQTTATATSTSFLRSWTRGGGGGGVRGGGNGRHHELAAAAIRRRRFVVI